jgi:hypothetical protein
MEVLYAEEDRYPWSNDGEGKLLLQNYRIALITCSHFFLEIIFTPAEGESLAVGVSRIDLSGDRKLIPRHGRVRLC